MKTILTDDSHKKNYGICQLSLLLLALLLQLVATSGLRWLVEIEARHVFWKMCGFMLVIVVATLVLLALSSYRYLQQSSPLSLLLMAQCLGLLVTVRAFYVFLNSLDIVGSGGVIPPFTSYAYLSTLLFSGLVLLLLYAKKQLPSRRGTSI